MINALTVLQIFLVIILILLVFMQKSNSDGVANLTAQSGPGSMSRHTSIGLAAKLTMIVAVIFMLNSLLLSKLTYSESSATRTLIRSIGNNAKNPTANIERPETTNIEKESTNTNTSTSTAKSLTVKRNNPTINEDNLIANENKIKPPSIDEAKPPIESPSKDSKNDTSISKNEFAIDKDKNIEFPPQEGKQ